MIILLCFVLKFKFVDKKDFVKLKNSVEKKMNMCGFRKFF